MHAGELLILHFEIKEGKKKYLIFTDKERKVQGEKIYMKYLRNLKQTLRNIQ